MIARNCSYVGIDTAVPANGYPMPDRTVMEEHLFRVFKHVWRGYLELVFSESIVDDLKVVERQPDFLKKNQRWIEIGQEVTEIVLVTIEAFNVKGQHLH